MSKISDLIFKKARHRTTSSFGYRKSIRTGAGKTGTFHNGTDYGTYGKKIPQFAIETGYVFSAARSNSDGAKYVWVIYPRVKLAMLHYHLDSYKVTSGQRVSKGTLLGYTGMTGKASGIHLHLGVRDLSKLSNTQVNNMTWGLLRMCPYVNPAKVSYSEATSAKPSNNSFLPKRGYWMKGDKDARVGKLCEFLYTSFPSYEDVLHRKKENLKGNVYGDNCEAWVKEFQRRTGILPDGKTGPTTYAKLKSYGFKG